MIGHPLPMVILENKMIPDVITGIPAMTPITSGHPDLANVSLYSALNPYFKCLGEPGKFLVILCTETKRIELSVEITTPTSAAIARNENVWRPLSIDQLMSVSFEYSSSGGGSWPVSTYAKQNRSWLPWEHVSHSFTVDLAIDEDCEIAVTSSATDRQWMLVIFRLPRVPTLEHRDANVFLIAPNVSTGLTSALVATENNVRKYRLTCTSGTNRTATFSYGLLLRAGYAYIARIVLWPNTAAVSIAGFVTVKIKKDATVLVSVSLAIPLAGNVTRYEYSITSGTFTGAEAFTIEISDIDNGESFEIEQSCNVV